MTITVECAKGFDGRWFAEVPQLPGVQAYGATREAATQQALSLVFGVLESDRELGVTPVPVEVYGRQSERRPMAYSAAS